MKRFMLAAITVALVAINPVATADPGWNGGGQGGNAQGRSPTHAAQPQGKNNAGRRPHDGNGSSNYNGYNGNHYAGYPQGKNNAGRRPHYGNGSNYYVGYPYRGGYPYKGWYGHPGYYYPRPYYAHAYPYYGYRPYPAYYGYPAHYGHHDHDNNSDWPAYLIGGAILGSVLTNVYHNSQEQQYAPANQVVVAPQGRHLLRDLNGNCFERTTDANGNELRTELPASQCNW